MIGDWITLYFDLYLTLYGDPDVAAVATAATINHILTVDHGEQFTTT
tara:strand:+ start:1501 stop:1641 length:141 start_codon:yes stop_codon:yes gene_type:complete